MASSSSRIRNVSGNTEDEDVATVEDIEQLCSRMSNYDPCFRVSLLQHHLKRLGIMCKDDRLVKMLSLSFETMIRSIVTDCVRIQQNTNGSRPSTLTSDALVQALLESTTDHNTSLAQQNTTTTSSTFDPNNIFDM